MTIGIVVGSIRKGRAGEAVGTWVKQVSESRDHDYTLVDLADFDLPLFDGDTPPMALNKQYDNEKVTAWSKAIDACDAFIFVTPEYNHSVPGAFKNAVDHLGSEWQGKPVAFIGYGASGGVRAVEHWRTVLANFNMRDIRTSLELNLFADWTEGAFTPQERRSDELEGLLNDLEAVL